MVLGIEQQRRFFTSSSSQLTIKKTLYRWARCVNSVPQRVSPYSVEVGCVGNALILGRPGVDVTVGIDVRY